MAFEDQNTFERAVRAHIATGAEITSSKVIPGNDKGPRSKGLYASLLFMHETENGYPVSRNRDTEDMTDTAYWKTTVFSLQFYRENAVQAARRFVDYLESDAGILAEAAAGFRIERPHEVRRLDVVVDDRFEERAVIELKVKYVYNRTQSLGTIETISGEICTEETTEEFEHAGN